MDLRKLKDYIFMNIRVFDTLYSILWEIIYRLIEGEHDSTFNVFDFYNLKNTLARWLTVLVSSECLSLDDSTISIQIYRSIEYIALFYYEGIDHNHLDDYTDSSCISIDS